MKLLFFIILMFLSVFIGINLSPDNDVLVIFTWQDQILEINGLLFFFIILSLFFLFYFLMIVSTDLRLGFFKIKFYLQKLENKKEKKILPTFIYNILHSNHQKTIKLLQSRWDNNIEIILYMGKIALQNKDHNLAQKCLEKISKTSANICFNLDIILFKIDYLCKHRTKNQQLELSKEVDKLESLKLQPSEYTAKILNNLVIINSKFNKVVINKFLLPYLSKQDIKNRFFYLLLINTIETFKSSLLNDALNDFLNKIPLKWRNNIQIIKSSFYVFKDNNLDYALDWLEKKILLINYEEGLIKILGKYGYRNQDLKTAEILFNKNKNKLDIFKTLGLLYFKLNIWGMSINFLEKFLECDKNKQDFQSITILKQAKDFLKNYND